MILIIDNFDSFVHNLARYVRIGGAETHIARNDEVSVADCLAYHPDGVIISPGPQRPVNAGLSLSLIEALPPTTPLLGVCLGHQCLVEVCGGKTERSKYPLHGEASEITHHGAGIFRMISSPMTVGRYHSLISKNPVGGALTNIALSKEGELMGVAHKTRPWFGVQFHPESLLTPEGGILIKNFLNYCNVGVVK